MVEWTPRTENQFVDSYSIVLLCFQNRKKKWVSHSKYRIDFKLDNRFDAIQSGLLVNVNRKRYKQRTSHK